MCLLRSGPPRSHTDAVNRAQGGRTKVTYNSCGARCFLRAFTSQTRTLPLIQDTSPVRAARSDEHAEKERQLPDARLRLLRAVVQIGAEDDAASATLVVKDLGLAADLH